MLRGRWTDAGGRVGAGRCHGSTEDLERIYCNGVIWDSNRDGGKTGTNLVHYRARIAALKNQCQRSWPESFSQLFCAPVESDQLTRQVGVGDMNDKWIGRWSFLGVIDRADCFNICRISGEAIDRLGRQGDKLPCVQQPCRFGQVICKGFEYRRRHGWMLLTVERGFRSYEAARIHAL